jgi:hypothetical protein
MNDIIASGEVTYLCGRKLGDKSVYGIEAVSRLNRLPRLAESMLFFRERPFEGAGRNRKEQLIIGPACGLDYHSYCAFTNRSIVLRIVKEHLRLFEADIKDLTPLDHYRREIGCDLFAQG